MNSNFFPPWDSSEYKKCGTLDLVPNNVSFLENTIEMKNQSTTSAYKSQIGFRWHPGVQHTTIDNFQPQSYYGDYLMTTGASASIRNLQKTQIEKLISLSDNKVGNLSIVEIGCGDGSFLHEAKKLISRVVGIEPSRRFAAKAIEDGFDVITSYVSSENPITDERFDFFAARQVFEHLPDPLDVLLGIKMLLKSGAIGLIEVPNGIRALRMKRFFEFFPDHVNYFSVNSLVALATDAKLNVISCQEAFGGDYLELYVRNDTNQEVWFSGLTKSRDCAINNLRREIDTYWAEGKKIAIFGCGAKTLCILAACPLSTKEKISCIIDSDPNKHNHFVPESKIPIVSVNKAREFPPDVVVILALSYIEEIAQIVKNEIPECSRLLTLTSSGEVLVLN